MLEKVEGMAITKDNRVFIVTDNDGVDNSNGETQLIEINDQNKTPSHRLGFCLNYWLFLRVVMPDTPQ